VSESGRASEGEREGEREFIINDAALGAREQLSRRVTAAVLCYSAFLFCPMVPSQDSGAPPVHVDVIVGFDFPPACSCWARLPAVVLETVFGLVFRPLCLTAAYRQKAVYFGGLGFMSVSARSKHREDQGLSARP
jgi:hypothetical protein